jgi:hypothetical protein
MISFSELLSLLHPHNRKQKKHERSRTECCLYAGTSRSPLYDYVTLCPEFADSLEELRQAVKVRAKESLAEAIEKKDRETSPSAGVSAAPGPVQDRAWNRRAGKSKTALNERIRKSRLRRGIYSYSFPTYKQAKQVSKTII